MYVIDIFDDPNPDPTAAGSAVSQSELDFAATRDLRDLRDSANWATSQLYAKRVLLASK
jgi:hypothetical protein